jgi:Tol biopolymer transport system component
MADRIAPNLHRSSVTIEHAIATLSSGRNKAMNTRKSNHWIPAAVLAGLLATATLTALAQKKDAPDVLLQRAIQKEMVDGNLKAAIDLYKRVIETPGVSARVAADALMHMGASYEKMGDAEARKAYERVVRDYSSQPEFVAEAQRRLAAFGQPPPSAGLTARLICTDCGDSEASITADGRLMAFTDWETGDIAIRDLTTGRITHLMLKTSYKDSDVFGENPLLSPDLRNVAYAWFPGSGRYQLRVAPREAGAQSTILVDNPEFTFFEPAAWSGDGKSVLVTLMKPDKTAQLAWVSVADRSIRILKSLEWRSRGPVQAHPSLSPDGRYIAYAALAKNPSKPYPAAPDSTDAHIYVLPANGSGPETELVKGAGQNVSPTWTPDGRHILFLSDRYGSAGVWSVAVQDGRAAGAPELVRADTVKAYTIGITKTGTLYYAQRHDGFDEVFISEIPQSGNPRPSNPGGNESTLGGQQPAWSPDGNLVAFNRRRGGPSTYDIVVRRIETGEEKLYFHEGYAWAGGVIWFHDSRAFLAWGNEQPGVASNNNRVLYRVDLESKEWKPLLTVDVSAMAPGWGISPDAQTLYKGARDPRNAQGPAQVSNRPFDRILALDLKTGTQKQVLPLPETAYAFRLSPDGRTFMLLSQPDTQKKNFHLSRMSVDGSGYRRLIEPGSGIGEPPPFGGQWTKDSRAFFFAVTNTAAPGDTARSRIMRIPAEGGKPEYTGMTVAGLGGIDPSPDGSRIAYSATTTRSRSELWALDNINFR